MGVELALLDTPCNLESVNDSVCVFDVVKCVRLSLDRLTNAVTPFSECFASAKFQVIYRVLESLEPSLSLNGVRLVVVNHFT